MKKLTSLIIATLCTVMTFTSCEEVSEKNLVGIWRLTSTEFFYEDGTTKVTRPQNGEWEEYTFTQSDVKRTSNEAPDMIYIPYTVEDDNIVIGIVKLEIVKLTNNTLKIKKNYPPGFIDYTISTYKKI